MKKIVILDGYTENPGDLSWDEMAKLGDLTVYDRTPKDKIIERMSEAEFVFTNKTPIDKKVIDASDKLEYIGVLATGYNVVDIEYAKSKGIIVTNIPAYSTDSVAQFVFALLLEVCHHVGHHSNEVFSGKWTESIDFSFWDFLLIELANKKIGVIGYGNIGKRVCQIAKAFGMEVIVYDYNPSEKDKKEVTCVDLETLFSEADIISLHVPLFPSTKHIINKNSILKMKKNAIVINTSRGPLVKEKDMADALNNNRIFYYAADVVSVEPIEKTNPLLEAKNCILTPHIAWAPREARQRLMNIAVENLKQFQQGNVINAVNN